MKYFAQKGHYANNYGNHQIEPQMKTLQEVFIFSTETSGQGWSWCKFEGHLSENS